MCHVRIPDNTGSTLVLNPIYRSIPSRSLTLRCLSGCRALAHVYICLFIFSPRKMIVSHLLICRSDALYWTYCNGTVETQPTRKHDPVKHPLVRRSKSLSIGWVPRIRNVAPYYVEQIWMTLWQRTSGVLSTCLEACKVLFQSPYRTS